MADIDNDGDLDLIITGADAQLTNVKLHYILMTVLLAEIDTLKRKEKLKLLVDASNFELSKEKIQASINRKLNKTDWSVLNVLLQ